MLNDKKIGIILLAFTMLLIVGLFSYTYPWLFYLPVTTSLSLRSNSLPNQPYETMRPPETWLYSISGQADENGWKMFASKEFGFEMKIPGDWKAGADLEGPQGYQQTTGFTFLPKSFHEDFAFDLNIKKGSLEEEVARIKQEHKIMQMNVDIGGIKVVKLVFNPDDRSSTDSYLFEHNGKLYTFYNAKSSNKEYTAILEKMISSFRFVE